ncbi:hypothetical protein L208DRAFT_610898 [Tricholoma matsutake]|nr:hypothetical protein L208DRAFT_699133 [Tricholoma matsutake 945]KAF8222223.1 hypothetical protein L208DRAFT_610898 [Tricholoma matsutake 945]
MPTKSIYFRVPVFLAFHLFPNSRPITDALSHACPTLESHPVQHHSPRNTADPIESIFGPLVSALNGPLSFTKPIPPPVTPPRKQGALLIGHEVVYPPKDTCSNLKIFFPSIPEGGTKSRVETQVRVTVHLAGARSSSDTNSYDRIGSWKWLKLPPRTTIKQRTRKEGKLDPPPQDILYLSATVTCASPPHRPVVSCSICRAREAKRFIKKLSARLRPMCSDTDSGGDDQSSKKASKNIETEDTNSIIQFHCAEVLDFSTGSVVLPLRISCYCRHHCEKVGFTLRFTMMDHAGRIVGSGSSRPIMITDDHKQHLSAQTTRQAEFEDGSLNVNSEQSQAGGISGESMRQPSKRRKDLRINTSTKKRAKPNNSPRRLDCVSREGSIEGIPYPTSVSSLPTMWSPTPSDVLQPLLTDSELMQHLPHLQYSPHASHPSSSSDSLITPLDGSSHTSIIMADDHQQHEMDHNLSPFSLPMIAPPVVTPTHADPMFFDFSRSSENVPTQLPIIHRLIPDKGPMHGGIEVTVLGLNFHPSLQLNCVFGDVTAVSTRRWSDNTLVCVLPPRTTADVVSVYFNEFSMEDQTNPSLCSFTYVDESVSALMELALQVVGLKITGKVENARDVALSILSSSDGAESHDDSGINGSMIQLGSTEIRELHSTHDDKSGGVEKLIIDFLEFTDVPSDRQASTPSSTGKPLSNPMSSGQTLLHLASSLGFSSLVNFLLKRGVGS